LSCLGSVLAATALRAAIYVTIHEQIPFTTFYPAVMLAALYCGLYWGMAAVALSAVAASFWLVLFGQPLITEPTDPSSTWASPSSRESWSMPYVS
jgi:biotin transporter BioY